MSRFTSEQSRDSVEDILASIRHIITQDNIGGAMAALPDEGEETDAENPSRFAPSSPPPGLLARQEESASRNAVQEEGRAARMRAGQEALAEADESSLSDEVLELTGRGMATAQEEGQEDGTTGTRPSGEGGKERETPDVPGESRPGESVLPLIPPVLAATLSERLKALKGMSAEEWLEGDRLESLAREALRPALARWLDENLEPMVERILREEIRRIADGNH